MESSILYDLLEKVKQNKKYKNISDEIILEHIKIYLDKNNIKKISKKDVSDVRASLHRAYSSFQTRHKKDFHKYLEELKDVVNKNANISIKDDNEVQNITNNLLSISVSTKERLLDYEYIYKSIFNFTGKPNTIIDLGSGFNPISFPFMHLNELNYYAYEIDNKDIILLNDYFDIMGSYGLNGKAEILNVTNKTSLSNLPKSDIVFMFKLIDIIDKEDHKKSEELIEILSKKTRFIVASFASKTISRKKMNFPKRKWFELMLDRIGLKFQSFETDNEIFYIVDC